MINVQTFIVSEHSFTNWLLAFHLILTKITTRFTEVLSIMSPNMQSIISLPILKIFLKNFFKKIQSYDSNL